MGPLPPRQGQNRKALFMKFRDGVTDPDFFLFGMINGDESPSNTFTFFPGSSTTGNFWTEGCPSSILGIIYPRFTGIPSSELWRGGSRREWDIPMGGWKFAWGIIFILGMFG